MGCSHLVTLSRGTPPGCATFSRNVHVGEGRGGGRGGAIQKVTRGSQWNRLVHSQAALSGQVKAYPAGRQSYTSVHLTPLSEGKGLRSDAPHTFTTLPYFATLV